MTDGAVSLHTDGDGEVGGGEESTAAHRDDDHQHGVQTGQLPRPGTGQEGLSSDWGRGGRERPVDADKHSAEDEDHVDQGQADDQLVECFFEIFLAQNYHADHVPYN